MHRRISDTANSRIPSIIRTEQVGPSFRSEKTDIAFPTSADSEIIYRQTGTAIPPTSAFPNTSIAARKARTAPPTTASRIRNRSVRYRAARKDMWFAKKAPIPTRNRV